jgi:hypothetical protein
MTSYVLRAALLGLFAVSMLPNAASAAASAKNEPPSCSAITFRPLAEGSSDGEDEAGLYKSRFGRIVVNGSVKGGQAQNYYVTINGTRPAAASGALPASVAACAQSKKLPAPGKATEPCLGDRFQVLVSHAGNTRHVLFYGRQSGKWQLCSAGTA